MLSAIRKRFSLNDVWIVLMIITFINTGIAENAQPDAVLTVFVCASIAIKGPLVADYFMGLLDATPTVRWIIYSYVIGIPAMIGGVIILQNFL